MYIYIYVYKCDLGTPLISADLSSPPTHRKKTCSTADEQESPKHEAVSRNGPIDRRVCEVIPN